MVIPAMAAGAAKAGLLKKILTGLGGALATGGVFALGSNIVDGIFDDGDESPVNQNPQSSQQVPQPPLGQTPPILPRVDPQTPGSIDTPDPRVRRPLEAPDVPELKDKSPDPELQQYGDLINKITDPRYQFIVGEQNLDRQMRSRAQAAELTSARWSR